MVMPFSDEIAGNVYENIVRPVCQELGFEVVRADEITSTQVIYDDIVQSINNATITIVDISGKNPNVMYELGMAHVLNQPATIMLTHDDVGDSPFDIQHFRMIAYKNTIEGAKNLETILRKTIEQIRHNYRVFFRQEYEFFITVLESIGKKADLITFLGLKNYQGVIHTAYGAFSRGTDGSNSESLSHNMSIGSILIPFWKMQLVEINDDIVTLTEKGKAFADLLEELGYKCTEIRIGSNMPDPMAEILNVNFRPNQQGE